ncbi:MAG: alcohol dehydrogenase [Sandaracinus sp.]|nr:alcohol dehydrogenase [Sandaracinus sp.]
MKALRFVAGTLEVAEQPWPVPEAGEVRVRVTRAGVCNTDLEIVRGYMGFEGTLGHEMVGVVEAAGKGAEDWIGTRVVSDINLPCGSCARCQAGEGHHCADRTVLGIAAKDGAFAEAVTLPTAGLVRVPEGVSDDAAVFAEPLAAAFEILEQVPVSAGDRVLVLGDGKLGLLCAMVLAGTGADVALGGRHPRKVALAEAAGVRARGEDEAPFDLVVEATGSPAGLREAQDRVRPRGTIVLKSTFAASPDLDTNGLVIDEVRLVGSRCGPMDRAVEALASGSIDPTPLIDARYPLVRGVDAVEHAQRRGTLKILLEP